MPQLPPEILKRFERDEWFDRVTQPDLDLDQFELPLKSLGDLDALSTQSWQIKDLFHLGGLVFLFGESGLGKSFVALDWALSVVTGWPWLGRPVSQPGSVVYIAGEGSMGMRSRQRAWLAEHFLEIGYAGAGGEWVALPDWEPPGDFTLVAGAVNFLGDEPLEKLEAFLLEFEPVLLVVDTLAMATPGVDENAAQFMGQFIDNVKRLATKHGTTALVVHHPNRAGTGMRGSGANYGAADTVIELRKQNKTALELFVDKQKDGPDKWTVPIQLVETSGSMVVRERSHLGDGETNTEVDATLVLEFVRANPGVGTVRLRDAKLLGREKLEATLADLLQRGLLRDDGTGGAHAFVAVL